MPAIEIFTEESILNAEWEKRVSLWRWGRMTTHKSAKNPRREHVEIDDEVKNKLLEGIKRCGNRNAVARVMGYSTPTNIISQFISAPKYKKFIPRSRLQKLEESLRHR